MGKAIAELYAKEGAKVIVADLNLEGANAVAEGIQNKSRLFLLFGFNITKKAKYQFS